MPRLMLNNKQWTRLKAILLKQGIYDKENLRKTVEGILYHMRTGIPWRDLPKYFGKSNTIYKTFNRWSATNKFMDIFKQLIDYPDMEWIFIDGTYVKAHQHSNVANPKKQAIGQSVGGNTSKIHLAVDAHGNPLEFIITDGSVHDVKVAPELIAKLDLSETSIVCADKGYDSEPLREQIEAEDTHANIPVKSNNKKKGNHHMDWHLYKCRHVVENQFNKIKNYRAIATRFDKLKRNYENNVALALAYQWLKL